MKDYLWLKIYYVLGCLLGWVGGTFAARVVRGYIRSLEIAPFDIARMSSY